MRADCDESQLKAEESNPIRLAERLAHDKAASLAAGIGRDDHRLRQVLSFQGQVFGKPVTEERAVEQLACAGRPDARADHGDGGDQGRTNRSATRT